jgi:hypothetical protein
MEESGVKWVIERFYRGLRNPLAAKPPTPNLQTSQTFISRMHYIPNTMVCQTFYAQKNITKKL